MNVKASNEIKIQILLDALKERYSSIHIIRERVQVVCVWALGLVLVASGYFYQTKNILSLSEKTYLVLFTLLVWLSLKYFFFINLEKGFNKQRIVAAKIEEALGFYQKEYFNENNGGLYPEEWRLSGQKGCEGDFIKNIYNLLALGFGILAFSIYLNGFL